MSPAKSLHRLAIFISNPLLVTFQLLFKRHGTKPTKQTITTPPLVKTFNSGSAWLHNTASSCTGKPLHPTILGQRITHFARRFNAVVSKDKRCRANYAPKDVVPVPAERYPKGCSVGFVDAERDRNYPRKMCCFEWSSQASPLHILQL
jgi:hypothetical protein